MSSLGSKDPKRPSGVTDDLYGALMSKECKDGDNVGQVKKDDDGKLV